MNERILWADTETYSPLDLKTYGTARYAEEAEVMVWTYALDDGPVQMWDCTANPLMPNDLADALDDDSVLLNFHNSFFDRTVLWATGIRPPIHRFRDTMVKAMAHSLPGALEKIGEILKLEEDQKKHKRGKELIQLFCKPRPRTSKLRRATRETHPAEWAEFLAYAVADTEAMRASDKKLPAWNYRAEEVALWHLDQQINSRGVAVDVELAKAAIRAADRAQKRLAHRTNELTDGDVQAATQRNKLLMHILASYDIEVPDLKTSTIERILNNVADLPPVLIELLNIRLQASKTSTSKYKRLVHAVSSDGRLRGTLQFNGASRTGRWAGRLFQPQNLPRPVLKQAAIDQGIEALKADCEDLLFGNVMELTSSAIRGAIVAPKGKKLVVADLSNIEGRVLAFLAGEEWKLQAFADFDTVQTEGGDWITGTELVAAYLDRRPVPLALDAKGEPIRKGHDLYKLAYAKSFGIKPEAVSKDNRQVGKVQELALGYEGGVGAFLTFAAAYNIDLEAMGEQAIDAIPDAIIGEAARALEWTKQQKRPTFGLSDRAWLVCDSFKRSWRYAHPAISSFWKDLEEAARLAVMRPGVTYECRMLKLRRDGAWLRIRLPSGRFLCYPSPQLDDAGKLSYMGVNQYSRKWSRLKTYGGKLAENVTQAASRDVLAGNMPAIEAAGYQIVLSVHDENITEAEDRDEFNADHLAGLMATTPTWAKGLPLAAAGFEAYRYRKD